MWRCFQKKLTTTLLLFFTSLLGLSQFSFTPKKANIQLKYSAETGWTVFDITGTKTITTFLNQNAYLQIIGDQLNIYTMSNGLWNTHPPSKFMDKIHIPHESFHIETNPSRFDAFSSFWISATGGHIRIFKYKETISTKRKDGTLEKRSNQNVANRIFLNGNSKTQISSKNTLFMIAPKGNIFEIDHELNIWRFILTNRTLTPWTSEPPTEKMVFHIFDPIEFKSIIPVGKKDNRYIFQIIDHHNKMGIASLSMDYFQIEYDIPPLFDFISPSLHTDFHLIFNEKKMGILHFLPIENENEIPLFKIEYTTALHVLQSTRSPQSIAKIMVDDVEPPNSSKEGSTSKTIEINHLFGIEKITDDLLLYKDYSLPLNIHGSGLYRMSQGNWYISPKRNLIKTYPTAFVDHRIDTNGVDHYSVFNKNGKSLTEDVTNKNSAAFFFLTGKILEMEIDSMVNIPEFESCIYKCRVQGKWGLVKIDHENFQTILPPIYQRIDHMGYKKSLVLTNEHTFDWYGIDYTSPDSSIKLVQKKNPLHIYKKNSLTNTGTSLLGSAQFLNELYIYNQYQLPKQESFIYNVKDNAPILSAKRTHVYPSFLHVEQLQGSIIKHSLWGFNLKQKSMNHFDSISVHEEITLFYNLQIIKEFPSVSGKTYYYSVTEALLNEKPLKEIKKYNQLFFCKSLFIAFTGKNWNVIDPYHIREFTQNYSSFEEALLFIDGLP